MLTGAGGLLRLFSIQGAGRTWIALDETIARMTLPQLARYAASNKSIRGDSIRIKLEVELNFQEPLGWPLSRTQLEHGLQLEAQSWEVSLPSSEAGSLPSTTTSTEHLFSLTQADTNNLRRALKEQDPHCVLTPRTFDLCDAAHLVKKSSGKDAYKMAQEALSERCVELSTHEGLSEELKEQLNGRLPDATEAKKLCLGDGELD